MLDLVEGSVLAQDAKQGMVFRLGINADVGLCLGFDFFNRPRFEIWASGLLCRAMVGLCC